MLTHCRRTSPTSTSASCQTPNCWTLRLREHNLSWRSSAIQSLCARSANAENFGNDSSKLVTHTTPFSGSLGRPCGRCWTGLSWRRRTCWTRSRRSLFRGPNGIETRFCISWPTPSWWMKLQGKLNLDNLNNGLNQSYTVGARIPNEFGFWMVDDIRIMVSTIWNPNYG